MRVITFLFLFLFFNTVFGQTKVYIPEPYGDNFIESELIGEVSFVPLVLEKYGMIAPDMEMKVDGEDYFILDNKFTQCVYHFNSKGELIQNICEQKSTQEEDVPVLNNPAKFNLNPYKKEIEIYNFENSIVHRFNYSGNKQGEVAFNVTPSDFVCDENGNYWVYTGWNSSETQYRLIRTDGNGITQERKMRLISKCTPTGSYSFYISPEKIFMWELFGNTIYSIQNNSILPEYLFDFGASNLPLNYHMLKGDDSFQMISKAGYYTVNKYVGNKNFAYVFLNYINASSRQREMFHVIHDKKAGQVYVYTENSAIGAFNKAQAITDNDELVFLVSPRKIRQLLSSGTEFVPAPFIGLVDDIGRSRNPIILKVKL
ncbi:MAG: 6-bladed beta-propeller, partial [Prolixibacteraceae bacterium]|nr:6-bladed beta-propeller [Prolixibacteraceae bacterium]